MLYPRSAFPASMLRLWVAFPSSTGAGGGVVQRPTVRPASWHRVLRLAGGLVTMIVAGFSSSASQPSAAQRGNQRLRMCAHAYAFFVCLFGESHKQTRLFFSARFFLRSIGRKKIIRINGHTQGRKQQEEEAQTDSQRAFTRSRM